ncbi:membrane protein insertion efficiency factor YidD [bacterium]|nr:membrane protein insertion efficiency factor YidD [bacterium]
MILQDWASKGIAGARNVARNLQAPATAPVVEPADVLSTGSTAKDWTVLVYMDGRNRLATSSLQALNKMEQIGSNDRVNVVVQSTIEPHWRELHKDGMQAIPTRRYYVQRDDRPDQITSPIVGQLDASVPLSEQSLADFIQWGMKNFPSERTMVVIKKHGAGFARIAGSEGEADRAPLSARETRNALEQVRQATGKGVDVVAFDSCSMQQMEVAYQLKDVAKVMTGSPEDIVASIYPYGTILDGLTRHPEMNERQLGRWVVDAHKIAVGRAIHSAADLSKLAQFGQAMRSFTASVVEQKVARDVLYTAMLNSKSMEAGDSDALQFNFRDLGGFLQQIAGDERVPQSVRDTAQEARQSMSDSILKHYATSGRERLKRPTGYSTFLPWKALTPEVKASYAQLDYVKDTGWLELLDYTFSSGLPTAPAEPLTKSSWLTRLKRLPLKHYKKYISGYLPTACQYTPTCSQYTREAIETHGMFKGAWLGSLRVMSCNGHNSAGHDPVPGHVHGPDCNHPGHLPAGTASRDFLTPPPAPV